MRRYAPMIAVCLAMAAAPALAQSGTDPNLKERLDAPGAIAEQPAKTWLAVNFIGAPVENAQGETIGNINNLLVHESGKVEAAVIGTGGVLGIGEKTIAVPFDAVTIKAGSDGMRVFVVSLSREQLQNAAPFKQTEPSTTDQARAVFERASENLKAAAEQLQKSAERMTEQARDAMRQGDTANQPPEGGKAQ